MKKKKTPENLKRQVGKQVRTIRIPFVLLVISLIAATVIGILINSADIEQIINDEHLTINSENWEEQKSKVNNNTVVEVTGTLDQSRQIVQKNGKNEEYRYVAFEEFNDQLLVKFSSGFNSNQKIFIGKTLRLGEVNDSEKILARLNEPADYTELLGNNLEIELSQEDIEQIESATKRNFNGDTIVLLENDYSQESEVIIISGLWIIGLTMLFFSISLSLKEGKFRQKFERRE